VSFGRVAGVAPRGARILAVRAGGRIVAMHHLRGRRFDLRVPLPRREVVVRVTAVDVRDRRSSASVAHVFGLTLAARPRGSIGHLDYRLARRIVPLVRSFPGASAVYVRDLRTGAGAAWNARARFPAASTLKVAIALMALRSLHGKPKPGSYADALLRRALIYSDNEAANSLEVLFGGSTSGGSSMVDALMRDLGLFDTEMYGGYERGTVGVSIPRRVDEQPYWGVGKYTSAYDLAQLFAYVHLAAEGKGRLARRNPGFTRTDARYLLYLLAHSSDHGKLDRFVHGTGAKVLHKAGWITTARHDAGLVYWRGGVFAVAVMTYGAGVGTGSDVLAGRVTRRTIDRLTAAARRSTAGQRGTAGQGPSPGRPNNARSLATPHDDIAARQVLVAVPGVGRCGADVGEALGLSGERWLAGILEVYGARAVRRGTVGKTVVDELKQERRPDIRSVADDAAQRRSITGDRHARDLPLDEQDAVAIVERSRDDAAEPVGVDAEVAGVLEADVPGPVEAPGPEVAAPVHMRRGQPESDWPPSGGGICEAGGHQRQNGERREHCLAQRHHILLSLGHPRLAARPHTPVTPRSHEPAGARAPAGSCRAGLNRAPSRVTCRTART
jgi:hypothetical protein